MQIILVRHPELQEVWLPHDGHLDPPLSLLGREQAWAIAAELSRLHGNGRPIAAVYTSPLAAALEAASAIVDSLPGIEEAQVCDAITTLTPEVLPPDATDILLPMQSNAWSVIEMLQRLFPPEANLVLVSHELPIRLLVCRALEMELDDLRRFGLAPGSITTIEFRGARTLIATLNETCHLDNLAQA